MNNNCDKYENLGDKLENGNISNEEAASICNAIMEESVAENDCATLESMFHAIFTGVANRDIGDKIRTDIIARNLNKYDGQVLNYVIMILAFSEKEEYLDLIRRIGLKYNNLDIEDALTELSSRTAQSKPK